MPGRSQISGMMFEIGRENQDRPVKRDTTTEPQPKEGRHSRSHQPEIEREMLRQGEELEMSSIGGRSNRDKSGEKRMFLNGILPPKSLRMYKPESNAGRISLKKTQEGGEVPWPLTLYLPHGTIATQEPHPSPGSHPRNPASTGSRAKRSKSKTDTK